MATQILPLFPLPVVLFPGVALPLHIFEPRYRRLLADCVEGDHRFGLINLPGTMPEQELPRGRVGCVARIESVQQLPDGCSNIRVAGEERFALERLVDSTHPYHVGEVESYLDADEPREPLDALADDVLSLFGRVASAARVLGDDRAPIPGFERDPILLSYRIMSVVDTPAEARYALLCSRSPLGRLREIETMLSAVVGPLEERAAMHQRARGNGRGRGGAPEIVS